jgi:hypothetical protein
MRQRKTLRAASIADQSNTGPNRKTIATENRKNFAEDHSPRTNQPSNLYRRGELSMKRIIFLLVSFAAIASVVATTAPASGQPGSAAAAPYVTEIPAGYRDWTFISVAHEEGSLHSFAAVLGNDVAAKAFRDGTIPYPDGSIIVALHYSHVPSAANDKVFGQPQSFVPGPPTNIQFMVKDSTKYAATGGWGFGHFVHGKPATAAFMKPCFPCHQKASRDFVFTHYAP